ncbi:hypothetical protein SAMN04488543_4327 [Friedmanniella luteola]|uniref:Uncharacterized protein n=1 Tax=Friedmanniella luteola TaxID=546871 RepID=A0A1H2AA04_9ACTN|nr:hypothetical protein [Friedmanniella luteola]SDT42704.1 hypothetical protein SAMN04488543_4327 [Friedmanniella luteola]
MAEPAAPTTSRPPAPRLTAADAGRAELVGLLTDLRILVVDSGRVWWRLLPQLLGLYLLGWLGSQLALRLAVAAGEVSAWLALVLFSFNFVSLLTALVLILQLVGRELGIRTLIPAEEAAVDGRDESVGQLLAVTLLPFLGLYAAFGQVTEAASDLTVEQGLRSGFGADGSVLGVLNDASQQHPWRLLALVVGVYVLRRVIDALHERTGRQVLGLLVALVESFFMLLVILGGIRLFQLAMLWLTDRAFMGWGAAVRDAVGAFLARFAIDLPAVLETLTRVVTEQVWPVAWDVVSQPIIWLAVAALIYGSQVLSLAELWRKGQTYADRIPGAGTFARYRDKQALRRIGPPPRGVQRVAREAKEAFLGDVDDKYLPTFHSLRLVLRAGLVFLGSFVLVHAVLEAVRNYASTALDALLGGHTVDFWTVWGPWVDLASTLPFEPLRLCLLAVAFRRCLELFQQRSHAAAAPVLAPPATVGVGG